MSESTSLSTLKRALVEIRDLKARLAAAEQRQHEPIAIVGMGLRFPGGVHDAASYWQLLSDGVDAITEVPADRWPADELFDPDPDNPGTMVTKWGGFLEGVDQFDAPFFGISPREAESMDPQQRLLLEVTWEALEDAGLPADRLFGTDTGVFVGIGNSDYFRMLLADRETIDTYTTTGNALSIAAGRLAYVLGAQGPALSVDTACSSSLVAVHLAAQALRNGECQVALAAGVNLILTPELSVNFSRARMMAPDGRCKTFDASADGYVRSEGCGVVVLKRLQDAERDGDRIDAVLLGSAVNQDGRSGGLTAPNGPSQERVVTSALAAAGVEPAALDYVEAHGTGTLLGDPIEVRALQAVLGDRPPERPLLLGSVKTNIGHTETAAGIAGLLKVVLMLRHGVVPAHLHLRDLSPHLAGTQASIRIPTEQTPWPAKEGRRIAGVSSFGLSGTNAHVILGAAPSAPARIGPPTAGPEVLTLSARSHEALLALAGRYVDHLGAHPDQPWADVTFSASTGRSHLPHRLAVVAADLDGAARQLAAFAEGAQPADAPDTFAVSALVPPAAAGPLAMLFTGHGSHYAGMGLDLYRSEPVFAAALDRCGELLAGHLDRPLLEVLADEHLLGDMAHAQPALFSVQFALAELWASWGVRPTVVAGHSAGEYVAAVTAGVLSLEEGLRIIATRGRLMNSLPEAGEMVALFVDEATVAAVAAGLDGVDIAAVNGPATTVVSGRPPAVRALITALDLADDDWRPLDISVAAHSCLVEPMLDGLGAAFAGASLHRPEIGLVSSMTGGFVTAELTEAGYWQRHLRAPVRFADVFATLRASGVSTFVEIGPHPTLLGLGRRCWPDATGTWVPSLRRDTDGEVQMVTGVATLFAGGNDVEWAAFASRRDPARAPRVKVDLPTTPWQHQSYWSDCARPSGRRPAVAMWPAVVAAAEAQASQGPLDLQLDAYPRRWELLDELATSAIVAATHDLGLFTDAGERHTVADLIESAGIGRTYDHLLTRWFDHLVADGLLTRDDSAYVAPEPLAPVALDVAIAAARPDFVGVDPVLDYLGRCAHNLAAVLQGRETALATLFPDGSYETVDFLYGGWAVPRYFNAIARAAVVAAASARQAQGIRVLEIGAGTGGTTAVVLPAMVAGTRYTFTDVSDFFLARAAERFADFPFVQYALLDIERDPGEQGFAAGSFDVVVAANVLHATRNLDQTLAHVRGLLAPGGALVAYEGTTHPRWFDVTTGLIEGWQLFEDQWRTDVPLIAPDLWAQALEAADFDAVAAVPRPDEATAMLLHHVLVARASGAEVTASASTEARPSDRAAAPAGIAVLDPAAVDRLLAEALPDERHDVLVGIVRQAVAGVLRVADPARLQRDQPLLDLGFDSLMAVELRNVLRQGLGIQARLPATLVFDHPTISALASFLDGVTAAGQTARAGAPAQVNGSNDPGDPAPDRLTLDEAAVSGLSDDEVEALLLERLAELER